MVVADWTIQKLLAWSTDYFNTHRIDSPRSTAEILLAYALKLSRINLYTHYDQPLNAGELADFKALVKRRLDGEPVAYIVGVKGFWNLELEVTGDVLIPRPETECLVEAALVALSAPGQSGAGGNPMRVLELGTGSGAVVLSLASERSGHQYFASDLSVRAIEVARGNAVRNVLKGNVHFFSGDWFGPLSRAAVPFDVIVSNPPYIPSKEIARLQREIRQYEPKSALDGDHDGLGCLRQIILGAHDFLNPGGYLLLEIGYDQKAHVIRMIEGCGSYERVEFFKDYGGVDRVVCMRKKT